MLRPFFQAKIEQAELARKAANMTRQEMFDHGFLTVADLDDEELRYGRCRDRAGRIPRVTNKTQLIPRDLFDEMVLEHERRTDQKLRQQLDVMLDVMIDVATDDTVEPRDRLEAAKYLFERVAGKTPERVNVTVQKAPWEELMGGIAHMTREESRRRREGVVDAEVVEDVPEPSQSTTQASENGEARATGQSGRGAPPDEQEVVDERQTADWTHPNSQFDGGDGLGEQSGAFGDEPNLALRHHEIAHPAFAPTEPTPSHDNPANSSVTMLPHETGAPDEIAKLVQAQAELAERRKDARKRIQDAKKRRKIARATGADAWGGKSIDFEVESDGQVVFNLADDSSNAQIEDVLTQKENERES